MSGLSARNKRICRRSLRTARRGHVQQFDAQLPPDHNGRLRTPMSKRKSRGSRETSKLLEQMGLADDNEAPPSPPHVVPETRVLAEPPVSSKLPDSPLPAKRRSRGTLWALIIAVVLVAGALAAWYVFGARP